MSTLAIEALDKAIAGKIAVTLTSNASDAPVVVTGKFLRAADDGVWVQLAGPVPPEVDRLARENVIVTGAFVSDSTRYLFDTTLLKREKHHWLTDTLAIDALLVSMPEDVSSPEHRTARRHRVGDSAGGVYGKLYRADATGKPAEVTGTLWDISTGGVSFMCPLDKTVTELAGKTLVVVVHFRGKQILVPVRHCHCRQLSTRTVRLGLRFDFSQPNAMAARDALALACSELEARAK